MPSYRRLRTAMRDFREARKKGDQAACLRCAGTVFLSCADALPGSKSPPPGAAGEAVEDRERTECVGLLSELEAGAITDGIHASGPAWDGTLLRIILEFLQMFLKPTG